MSRISTPVLLFAVCASACMFSFTRPQDGGEGIQMVNWHHTTVAASTGTIDERDTREIEFRNAIARIKPAIDNAKSVIRYNLQLNLQGKFVLCDQLILFVRYKDNGTDSRIVAKLKAYDVQNGATDTLLTFDSNAHDPAGGFRRGTIGISGNGIVLLSPLEVYFVEVTFTKRSSDGSPELGSLEVWALPN